MIDKIKSNVAITLIALIITIIVLLILAGVVLNTVLGDEGIIRKSQVATEKTNYKSAKEIVQMKLLEIQAECVQQKKDYTIKEIATQMKDDEEILIEKYYEGPLASVKDGLGDVPSELAGIVVSVDSYESYKKYKFLIGNLNEVEGVIEGVLEGEISDTTKEEEFKSVDQFEKENFGEEIENSDEFEETGELVAVYKIKQINENNTMKVTVIFESKEKNIEYIIKPNEEKIVVNALRSEIEYEIEDGKEYKFKAKLENGEEEEYTLHANVNQKIQININQDTNTMYPVLTIDGIKDAEAQVEIDYGKNTKNYYSIDNGKTWKKYTKELIIKGNNKLIAKSIRENKNEINIIEEKDVGVSDAVLKEAYDGNMETYMPGGNTKVVYLGIDPSVWGKTIKLHYINCYHIFGFVNSAGVEFGQFRDQSRGTEVAFTIPEQTVKLWLYFNEGGGIYEIELEQ